MAVRLAQVEGEVGPMTATVLPFAPRRLSVEERMRRSHGGDYRVLVSGSRVWQWPLVIHRAIDEAVAGVPHEKIVIVHGKCNPRRWDEGKNAYVPVEWDDAAHWMSLLVGADWHADDYAVLRGWRTDPYAADWRRHGSSAGHRRNAEMVEMGASVCLGFPLGESPGTRGCLKLALAARIPIRSWEG